MPQLDPFILGAGAVGALFLFLVVVGLMVKRFYERASADEALVRTGMGGTNVIIGGGMIVLPGLHQLMRVSLRTITLTVERMGRQALVTADKIKACCTMELYIKVDDTEEAVITAARSFGARNVDEGVLAEIVEGKLTDALRGVAANKTFLELHAQREEFAEAVKKALVDELRKNGLKLESTSLTNLSQLPIADMDPNDVFDAEGLRNILSTVSRAQQESNEIDRQKEVVIQSQNVTARRRDLELSQEQAFLEADQKKQIAEYQAQKKAEERMAVLAQEQAAAEAALDQRRQVEQAKIAQEEAVTARDLQRQEAIARAEAEKNQAERTAQILAQKTIEAAEIERAEALEAAEIRKAKAIEAAQIEKAKAVEAADVAKKQAIEVATVEKAVALALAETEKSKAEAAKAQAEAEEAAAVEAITTAERTAVAQREKEIAVIKSREEAEQAQISADKEAYVAEVAAKAEREVKRARAEAEQAEAAGRANAVREAAQARADEVRLQAQATKDAASLEAEADAVKIRVEAEARSEAASLDAEAKIRLAEATLKEGEAEAEARRKMIEAENAVDSRILMLQAAEQAIRTTPSVVRELVKSAEVIGEMKVLRIEGGFPGAGGGDASPLGSLGQTPLGLGLTTLAQGTALLPLIKGLMEHAGVTGGDLVDQVKEAVRKGAQELVVVTDGGDSDGHRNGNGAGPEVLPALERG